MSSKNNKKRASSITDAVISLFSPLLKGSDSASCYTAWIETSTLQVSARPALLCSSLLASAGSVSVA